MNALAKALTPVPRSMTGEVLADEIRTLYAHINVATCALLEKIQQFDDEKLYGHFNCKSTAHWLNYACGIGLPAGREKVRVARALVDLPQIHAAFRAGTVSYSKVRALTRIATPASEPTLLQIAWHSTAAQTERVVRNQRAMLRANDKDPSATRSLTFRHEDDGSVSFTGRLSTDAAALFSRALEICLEHVPVDDDIPADARRADALLVMAEHVLGGARGSGSNAERFEVSVHVSAEALTGAIDPADPPDIDGGVVSAKTAERLSCDAAVVPIVESASGEPLSIGRKRRTVPPALRRALKRRDHGCRFPGCEQTRFVDAHHIVHWAHGGETNLQNLVLLCRFHHRALHEGKHSIIGNGHALVFRDPEGGSIPPTADDLSRGRTETLIKNVSAETFLPANALTPELDTRPPDYGHIAYVLDGLFAKDPDWGTVGGIPDHSEPRGQLNSHSSGNGQQVL